MAVVVPSPSPSVSTAKVEATGRFRSSRSAKPTSE